MGSHIRQCTLSHLQLQVFMETSPGSSIPKGLINTSIGQYPEDLMNQTHGSIMPL
jgi:hypothetical protein